MVHFFINKIENFVRKPSLLLFIFLSFPQFAASQDSLVNEMPNELHFEVNVNHPPLSITKENLTKAQTLLDLNKNYESSWVRAYISVELSTSNQGSIKKIIGKNDTLSQEQKDIINGADLGTEIAVKVQYIPENTLSHNDSKEMGFTFTVEPEIKAEYCGGSQQLMQYLKEQAIDKIPATTFQGYALAAVKFTIDEEGQIINPEVFWTSEDDKTDKLLLKTIRKMPVWKPAEYSDGTKVKQEFVLTVGNMESCVVNLLNIRRD